MKKELVIAAFNRDYEWVEQLNKDVRISAYNKARPIDHTLRIKSGEIFSLPNVGRDVHTFFKHIYEKYYCLADYTFFSQDYPFDHVSNYIEIINGDVELWNHHAKQKNDGCWFFCTQYDVLTCYKDGSPHHNGLPIELIWNILFNDPIPEKISFTPAGHFCVSKECVQVLPQSFYGKCVKILEEYDYAPWVMERLEPYIFFNSNKYNSTNPQVANFSL